MPEKELETIGNQLNRLRDLLEQGVYSPVTYLEREQILTERAEAAKVALAALENKKPPMNEAIRMQAPKIRDVLALYEKAQTPAGKNVML